MKKSGYTLLELLVIIAVISTASFGVYESIIQFQYQSQVENTANDFLATIKIAQSKSRDGEFPEGAVETDYKTDGLPLYGVVLTASDYSLTRHAVLVDDTAEDVVLETHTFDSAVRFTPATYTVQFLRLAGIPDTPQTISVSRGGMTTPRVIRISSDGIVSYE